MKGTKIYVLDHGFVRLVDYMGDDLAIVRSARVSYDAEWRAGGDEGKDEKLIRYLMTNKHTSPFESVVFQFEVKVPLFIARQWHRHRMWSYNEVSARYTELPEEFYVPQPEQITTQSISNKQMRTNEKHPMAEAMALCMREQNANAFSLYKKMLADGCPRELARSVLPVATYTRYFAKTDLHNLFHFIRLRVHPHAQYEVQQYGKALLELITPIVPVAVAAFKETLSV